ININPDFKFEDLKDMYRPVLFVTEYAFKNSIEMYLETEKKLIEGLITMMAIIKMSYHPEIKELINNIIANNHNHHSNALIENQKILMGDKKYTEVISEWITNEKELKWLDKFNEKKL